MKYKRLDRDELTKLEQKFVDFLVVNGITAEDWIELKEKSPVNASKMVDSFSDVIYEGWLRSMKYLEVVTPNEIMCFYYQTEQIVLVGMSTSDKTLDFTAMTNWNDLKGLEGQVEVYTTTKNYTKEREIEMFELLEKGAKPADEKLFNALCLAL